MRVAVLLLVACFGAANAVDLAWRWDTNWYVNNAVDGLLVIIPFVCGFHALLVCSGAHLSSLHEVETIVTGTEPTYGLLTG